MGASSAGVGSFIRARPVLQSPEMKAAMARQDAETFTREVPRFQAFLRGDVARSGKLVEAAGIEKE